MRIVKSASTLCILVGIALLGNGLRASPHGPSAVSYSAAENAEGDVRIKNTPASSCTSGCRSGDTLLLVSTMDGFLTAIDASDQGRTLWSLETGPKLLSSSLSNLEIIYGGVPTRLVPSLDGALYRLVQDDATQAALVEPLPFNADTLLSSSVKLTADATIVGSRETVTYGISADSGKVKYVCDKDGCIDSSSNVGIPSSSAESCLIVVRHSIQTVRAAALRTGIEKWNFSVGHHDVKFVSEHNGASGTCEEPCDLSDVCDEERTGIISVPSLKFDVSRGVIKAYDSETDTSRSCHKPLWTRQMSTAVSKAWLLTEGSATELNLFDEDAVLPTVGEEWRVDECPDTEPQGKPLLYIGSFEKQMYVQLSPQVQAQMAAVARQLALGARNSAPSALKVAWKPYMATAPSRTPWLNKGKQDDRRLSLSESDLLQLPAQEEHGLAIYEQYDYPFDNGYYMYADLSTVAPDFLDWITSRPPTAEEPRRESADDGTEDVSAGYFQDITYVVIQGSLWHYWKEVLGICIVFAAGVNIILYKLRKYKKMLQEKIRLLSFTEDHAQQPSMPRPVPVADTKDAGLTSPISDSRLIEYTSRYASDFEQIQCLGRGGFGVVFEARNKVDDCTYALKRISLPDSSDAKERVMREVKALAKLDHPGIVRYFQAWFETPPHDWRDDTGAEDLPPSTWTSAASTDANAVASGPKYSAHLSTGPFVPHLHLGSSMDNTSVADALDRSLVSRRVGRQKSADDSFDVVFAVGDTSTACSTSSRPLSVPFNKYVNGQKENRAAVASGDSSASEHWGPVKEGTAQHRDDSGCHNSSSSSALSSDGHEEEQRPNVAGTRQSHLSSTQKQQPRRRLLLFIQMQLCRRETLKDYLADNTLNRNRSEVLDIFYQIANAVEYIHQQGLIHRDLKPSNIFFVGADVVKVGDFGLVTPSASYGEQDGTGDAGKSLADASASTLELRKHTDNVGTQLYMSPEQVQGQHYNNKVDIYAMGLVFFELMYPFSTAMERCKIIQDAKRLKLPERFQRELPVEGNFVKWLLQPDPEKRPDIGEVLQSEILRMHDAAATATDARRARQRTVSRTLD